MSHISPEVNEITQQGTENSRRGGIYISYHILVECRVYHNNDLHHMDNVYLDLTLYVYL